MKPENHGQVPHDDVPLEWRTYSLDDLLDVERHLDHRRYPENFVILQNEIARRIANGERAVRARPAPSGSGTGCCLGVLLPLPLGFLGVAFAINRQYYGWAEFFGLYGAFTGICLAFLAQWSINSKRRKDR